MAGYKLGRTRTNLLPSSTTILDASRGAPGAKRGTTKAGKTNKLLPGKTGSMATAISGSRSGSPALSGIISPSLNPTPSAGEAAKEEARELRAPIVHELAVRELSFEELRSRWPGDKGAFKQVLDKVADFDNKLQKYTLKKLYWKELDTYKYDYESDEDRQSAIDNAIRMYDRMRMSASESVWDRLLPKEERGKGKCLSKLLPTIAKAAPQPAAKTPQIKVNDTEDSSGSKNGDGSVSGAETKKTKKASTPMSRQASQTKQPAKKIERKWVKKAPTPKVSPAKAGAKSKDKAGRVLSKEFISDSDSSSSEAPLSKTAPRAKKESEDREREREREREKEKEREIERDRQREREKEREREREKERLEKQKEREAAAAKQKARSSAPPKEVIKPQVIARPGTQKRPRDEAEEDSSSSSGTPLSKRVNKEIKAAPARASVSYKRPPSESSSQSSRTNNYVGHGYTSKNKNTSPVKSSPLASSPPTNASDMGQQTADENRHERERDRSRDRSVTVANGNINVKKRKMESDGDVIDVAAAKKKKRQRLSTDILNDARTFKKCYEVYQRLHYELSSGGSFSREKYETLMMQHRRLEKLKASIYAQIPAERDVY